MTSSEALEALETFCANPWEFQQTFETPLKNLQPFVKTILAAGESIQAASLIIDLVVFEPRALLDMLSRYSIPPTYGRGLCLAATGQEEVKELLCTVLCEWIDFLFIPDSSWFAIYADHDEFTTLYTHTRTDLDRVAEALSGQGFKVEANYRRRF